MKIFVTGGTGFIGSNFLKLALSNDLEVYALRRNKKKPKLVLDKQPIWIESSYEEVDFSKLQNIDLLLHIASYGVLEQKPSLIDCFENNVIGPIKLFEKAKEVGIKNFIVIGSCFEYGKSGLRYKFIPPDAPLEPTLPYGVSKAAASIAFTQLALQNNLNLKIKRLFHVYGEGEDKNRFYPSLIHAAENGLDFPMTKGQQIRDFLNVKEVAKELLKECKNINKGKSTKIVISNFGSGKETSLIEFSKKIWKEKNAKGKILFGRKKYREGEVMRFIPDIKSLNIIRN